MTTSGSHVLLMFKVESASLKSHGLRLLRKDFSSKRKASCFYQMKGVFVAGKIIALQYKWYPWEAMKINMESKNNNACTELSVLEHCHSLYSVFRHNLLASTVLMLSSISKMELKLSKSWTRMHHLVL